MNWDQLRPAVEKVIGKLRNADELAVQFANAYMAKNPDKGRETRFMAEAVAFKVVCETAARDLEAILQLFEELGAGGDE